MSISDSESDRIHEYYLSRFQAHGVTPQGVGWGPKNNQIPRFENLTRYWNLSGKTFLDVGAGTCDLYSWISEFQVGSYIGLELLPFYVDAARSRFRSPNFEIRQFDIYSDLDFPVCDFGTVSGTFNLLIDESPEDQYTRVEQVFNKLKSACKISFAANFLSDATSYRDQSLFYASSERILAMARQLSRKVILSHQDFPFEFTVYVWKDDSFDVRTSRFMTPDN